MFGKLLINLAMLAAALLQSGRIVAKLCIEVVEELVQQITEHEAARLLLLLGAEVLRTDSAGEI